MDQEALRREEVVLNLTRIHAMCEKLSSETYIFGMQRDQFMLTLQSAATYVYGNGFGEEEADDETVQAGEEWQEGDDQHPESDLPDGAGAAERNAAGSNNRNASPA